MGMRIKIFFLFFVLCWAMQSRGQITSGKIVYERKSNLYKKFKDNDWVMNWIKEVDKIKVDSFELFFNDTVSFFRPVESELKENLSWTTEKNTVYQNFNRGTRFTIKSIWGQGIRVTDSLYKRQWKITSSKRNISGYNCRKAIWQSNDSTRIYAWYSDEIIPSTGPESFYGLPGTILGLAAEDGGVIYFAKSIEVMKPDSTLFTPEKTKDKIYSSKELRTMLEKQYGKEKWGKEMIKNVFGYW